MKILYFSWIKDKIGKTHEDIHIPDNINTIEDLIILLKDSGESYNEVFKDISSIKVSINMETADFKDQINNNDEIAFFPPMTGG
ncbi:MAG: molybdopterin converting factor subunit 1 [Alphaproteobacteria bacterium TMED62]|nr:MAG: molybdopterin converting factor subunit 1 [Alphaproteobacteria bacterium TMED62]|tara:strand:+ start:2571 stop:2822 length:252 start_codon:yes stop_codon:yes gene_type:complete